MKNKNIKTKEYVLEKKIELTFNERRLLKNLLTPISYPGDRYEDIYDDVDEMEEINLEKTAKTLMKKLSLHTI